MKGNAKGKGETPEHRVESRPAVPGGRAGGQGMLMAKNRYWQRAGDAPRDAHSEEALSGAGCGGGVSGFRAPSSSLQGPSTGAALLLFLRLKLACGAFADFSTDLMSDSQSQRQSRPLVLGLLWCQYVTFFGVVDSQRSFRALLS